MRLSLTIALLLTASITVLPQDSHENAYRYTVDLTNVVEDRVYVELVPPEITEKEITFYFPKIIPGTYAIADYGRYVSDLQALDRKGRKLPVEKTEENTWKIRNANKLEKITYWVDDTWDTQKKGPDIFQPAGTNIEAGENYVINTSGFFGYFKDLKEPDFRLNIIRSKNLYGSTGLIPAETGSSLNEINIEKGSKSTDKVVDVYWADDYDHLIDSPLMYAEPDTAIINVGNAEVLIGSYSPTNQVSAKEIAASIREVLMAQKEFLGGTLPVSKYAFIFYFTDKPILRYGALEHSYSSFYYMPEMPIGQMNQQLRDFAAHEFFHILTPLTVHSKEIENFDFNDPEMSRHLWMYEGVTEYFASLVQVQYDLISIEEFIETVREKMLTAEEFINDVPFTEISKFTLDKYHDQYYNVYQKGALIALCLDVKLLELSNGEHGLRDLMLELSEKYGKDKPFEDDKLIEEITAITDPEIALFFERYVQGTDPLPSDTTMTGSPVDPLPFEEIFDKVGIIYSEEYIFEDYSLGIDNPDLGLTQDSVPKLRIATTAHLNEMGKALGFQEGDVLLEINGERIPELGNPDVSAFIQRHLLGLREGEDLSFTVLRTNSGGEAKETVLTAPVQKVNITQRHVLAPNPQATPEQLALRAAWLAEDL